MGFNAIARFLILLLSLHVFTCLEGRSMDLGHRPESRITKRQFLDPSIPLNLVFLDATEESIRVTWDPPTDNGGSPLTNYRIQAEERITFALHANLEIAASTTTFNITNLEPYKNYTIRVAAINAGFQRGPDASIIVQTLSLRLKKVSPLVRQSFTEILVRWNAPVEDIPGTTAPVQRFELNYTINGGPINIIDIPREDFNDVGLLVVVTIPIEPNTITVITVAGYNERGIGAIRDDVPNVVLPAIAPSQPRTFQATVESAVSARLTWEEPLSNGGEPITGYVIVFTAPVSRTDRVGSGVRSFTATFLVPNTGFQVTIQAENVIGLSTVNNNVRASGTTPPLMTPDVPSTPTVTDIRDTSAVITWTLSGGFPMEFELEYRLNQDGSSATTCRVDSNQLSKTLQNLVPLTSYVVRLRASNSGGFSDFSDSVTFTTFGAIMITQTPSGTVTAGEGVGVSLECLLQGAQQGDNIQYVWTKDGNNLPTGVQNNGGTLVISNALPPLSGEYTCTAQMQQITGSHQLTITPGVPGAPGNLMLQPVGETITISWQEATSNGDTVSYSVTIRLNNQEVYSGTTGELSLSVMRDDFQTMADAVKSTSYDVTVVAVNSAGTGGDITQTFTIPSALPGAPGNLMVRPNGETITISWQEATSNGGAVSYRVTIRLNNQEVYSGTTGELSLSVMRNDFQTTTDAVKSTSYDVTVVAVNSAGTGGDITQTFTISSALPGAVSNVQVNVEEDTISIQWVGPSGNPNPVALYNINVLLMGESVYTAMASGTTHSVVRDDLQEPGDVVRTQDTQYTVVVVARNSRGVGDEASVTFTMPEDSAAPPQLACSNSEESVVSLRVNCQVTSTFSFSTTCSYDSLPSQPCPLSFLLSFLDFEPGDHTLVLKVTALDGQTVNTTIVYTTPSRLSLTCSVINLVLSCVTTTSVSSQQCSFNALPQIGCPSPFDVRPLNLVQGDHNVSVSVRDVFGQTNSFSFIFSTIPSAAIILSFTERISLLEGTSNNLPLLFTITGQALEDIPFSLRSLTYQQFMDITGNSVNSIFSGTTIPSPASPSDFDAGFSESFTFSASQDMITTNYDIMFSVQEDNVFEGDEGFILYFEFNEVSIDAEDFSRLETGTRAILVTITDNDQLTVSCVGTEAGRGLRVDVACTVTKDINSTQCSLDDRSPTTCVFPLDITAVPPGGHNYTITVTSNDGQMASDRIQFTRPPHPTANCSVTGTILSCTTNNEPDSFFCLIDMMRGVSCSAEFDLQTVGIQVGNHVIQVFVRDEYFQQVDVDVRFTIVSDLEINCQEMRSGLTGTLVNCDSTGGIGSVTFNCSIDGSPTEPCGSFPVELELLDFSAEEHILIVTATDAAGQPAPYQLKFSGIAELGLFCIYSQDNDTIICGGNNDIVSSTCSFNGGTNLFCNLPLEMRLTGFPLGFYNISVTATDIFSQTEQVTIGFEFALGPINLSIPLMAEVIEGIELSPVMFSISGQALFNFPFSVTSLTYTQFQTQTGQTVENIFPNPPPPASPNDFVSSVVEFEFSSSAGEVTETYTYSANLTEDEENENIEGYILYWTFDESQFNSDDYSRLSNTSAVTLITLIDNDGLKLTCLRRDTSRTTFIISCNSSATTVDTTCSYDSAPRQNCIDFRSLGGDRFEFGIYIFDYMPGDHSVLVRVADQIDRIGASSVSFITPPLLSISCIIIDNILNCDSNNPIDSQLCQFDSGSTTACTSPLNVLDEGLSFGSHSVIVNITDIYGRRLSISIDFSVTSNLQLSCSAEEEEGRYFIIGILCQSTGGIGDISYVCSYDGGPTANCAGQFPMSLNLFEYSTEGHNFSVVVTDSAGAEKSFFYSFTGKTPSNNVVQARTDQLTVNEDGSFHPSGDLSISQDGYSFGEIVVTITPLTYSQYESQNDRLVAQSFSRQPDPASESDFESESITLTFRPGYTNQVHTVLGSRFGVDDTAKEITEGFVLLIAIDTASLDPRDVGRVSIKDKEDLILVSIIDDEDVEVEEPTVVLGLSADELAGIAAGIAVLIILLISFILVVCVCVIVSRRRKAAGKPGLFRSRSRQSKTSHSSERKIFHAAR